MLNSCGKTRNPILIKHIEICSIKIWIYYSNDLIIWIINLNIFFTISLCMMRIGFLVFTQLSSTLLISKKSTRLLREDKTTISQDTPLIVNTRPLFIGEVFYPHCTGSFLINIHDEGQCLLYLMARRESWLKSRAKAGGLIRWENHPRGRARGLHTVPQRHRRHKAAPGRIIQYNLLPLRIYHHTHDTRKSFKFASDKSVFWKHRNKRKC